MENQSSATQSGRITIAPADTADDPGSGPGRRGGLVLASLGVTAFSFTFPATLWALDGFGPWTVIAVRIVISSLLAGACLVALRVPRPQRRQWPALAMVSVGTIVGFPLLTTMALRTSSASHAAVVVGLLPLTTAVYATLRTGHRPSRTFWVAALAGAAAVLAFTLYESGGGFEAGDPYLAGALLLCAGGYAEGGRLAREMPGWQVVGWALIASLPVAIPGAVLSLVMEPAELTGTAVAGLLWLAIGSQFLGLLLWYRGLAGTGVARASQVQLAQPLLTLVWAVLLLGEQLTPAAPVAAVAVLVCIAVTQRARA